MLEKRKSRSGGSAIDNWDVPPLRKAQMAFEIIWFCITLYLISTLFKVISNVGSRQRQPYILLLVSAILLDIGLIMNAVKIRIYDTVSLPTYLALDSARYLLWKQPTVLITMAGLWVFRKRSQLIIYGKGARGIPYAGQTWKFVADWVVSSCSLLFLILGVIVGEVGFSLYYDDAINRFDYKRITDAVNGLSYVQFAFYFILTTVFVATGFTLNSSFKRQTGRPDVVTRQMLIWIMPWLIIRTLYSLIDLIVSGMNENNRRFDYLSLGLAAVIVNGACWTGVLFGFIKTVADPGPWDWSHIRAQQPHVAQYDVQAVPVQPSYYAPPVAPPPQV